MIPKPLAGGLRGQPPPYYVGYVAGNVIESTGIERRLMSKCEKGYTRTNAGAEDTDAFVACVLKPANCRARIEHRLAHRLDGAANVCADEMICALETRRSALLMIGQR